MSFDQKPGRVKIYSTGDLPALPSETETLAAVADEPASAAPQSAGGRLTLIAFLIGSMAGGAAIALSTSAGIF